MKIVAISDTHCQLGKVEIPDGDILIHAGDMCNHGRLSEIVRELNVLEQFSKKFQRTIYVPGNHDIFAEEESSIVRALCFERCITYLAHETDEFDGYKIFGSPYTPYFGGWAFNIHRGPEMAAKWNQIPDNVDILITHGPPYNILDPGRDEPHVGCKDLAARINVVKPRLHLFGHCHSGYGRLSLGRTLYINAAACDELHNLVNKPQVISL